MPLNNEYKRYFIILQEDDKGYELAAGKIPTGYVKIEMKNGKGKLTAYAQNVKNGDKADYHMLLVAPSKKAAVDVGRIMVDGTGRGELNVEFDADNVMKTGMNISDFMVAAVSSNTGIPLSGYTGRDKVQWKGAYNIINKTYDRIDKKTQPLQEVVTPVKTKPMPVEIPEEMPVQIPKKYEVIEEVKEVPVQVPKKVEIIEEVKEVPVQVPKKVEIIEEVEEVPVEMPEMIEMPKVEEVPEQPEVMPKKSMQFMETQTEIKAKFVIETEEQHEHKHYDECKKDCMDVDYKNFYYDDSDCDSDSDSDSDDREREKHHEHHEKEHEDKHSDYENPMQRRLMKVLERLRKYEPFDDEESREDWFKVEDDIYLLNNATIPFMGSMMPLGYPFMMNDCVMMIGRKDYIIGVKYEKENRDKKYAKYIMYGMPGMHNQQEETYYRMRGFTSFKPHKSKKYGYWIMIVDMRTGEIVMK